MRITVFSNNLSVHTPPLCLALKESDDVGFFFAALSGEPEDVERPNPIKTGPCSPAPLLSEGRVGDV